MRDSIESVVSEARECRAFPYWTADIGTTLSNPTPRSTPYLWPYVKLRELLLQASELISTQDAGRRVFRLINPGLQVGATETLSASLQCILQGERALAHRHTPFALRFVIEGSGAYTSVDGERLWMEPGDLILTPSWRYHDHGKDAAGPMIWLDGLDIPLFHFLRISFQENWLAPRESLVDARPDSNLRYSWTEMRARLLSEPGPYAMLPYLDRYAGGPISRTIGARAERLESGAAVPRRRTTASHIYNVIAGHGRSRIADAALEWAPGDTFAVPAWSAHSHENIAEETAYLFSYSDRPMLESLGLYREEFPDN